MSTIIEFFTTPRTLTMPLWEWIAAGSINGFVAGLSALWLSSFLKKN